MKKKRGRPRKDQTGEDDIRGKQLTREELETLFDDEGELFSIPDESGIGSLTWYSTRMQAALNDGSLSLHQVLMYPKEKDVFRHIDLMDYIESFVKFGLRFSDVGSSVMDKNETFLYSLLNKVAHNGSIFYGCQLKFKDISMEHTTAVIITQYDIKVGLEPYPIGVILGDIVWKPVNEEALLHQIQIRYFEGDENSSYYVDTSVAGNFFRYLNLYPNDNGNVIVQTVYSASLKIEIPVVYALQDIQAGSELVVQVV